MVLQGNITFIKCSQNVDLPPLNFPNKHFLLLQIKCLTSSFQSPLKATYPHGSELAKMDRFYCFSCRVSTQVHKISTEICMCTKHTFITSAHVVVVCVVSDGCGRKAATSRPTPTPPPSQKQTCVPSEEAITQCLNGGRCFKIRIGASTSIGCE